MLVNGDKNFGADSTKKTKSISSENTWTDVIYVPGDTGGTTPLAFRVTAMTGTPVFTIQVRGSGETDWQDLANSIGTVNGGTKIKPVGVVMALTRHEYRAGVKTGELNGGTISITFGA